MLSLTPVACSRPSSFSFLKFWFSESHVITVYHTKLLFQCLLSLSLLKMMCLHLHSNLFLIFFHSGPCFLQSKWNYSKFPHPFSHLSASVSTYLAFPTTKRMSSPSSRQRLGPPVCTRCHLFSTVQGHCYNNSLFWSPALAIFPSVVGQSWRYIYTIIIVKLLKKKLKHPMHFSL